MQIILELPNELVDQIVTQVVERLKPMLSGKNQTADVVYDVKELSQYLRVDKSWVYNQVHQNIIPYFKCGKYTRFRKSKIDTWIDKETVNPISLVSLENNRK